MCVGFIFCEVSLSLTCYYTTNGCISKPGFDSKTHCLSPSYSTKLAFNIQPSVRLSQKSLKWNLNLITRSQSTLLFSINEPMVRLIPVAWTAFVYGSLTGSRFIMNLDLAIEQLRCVLRRQHKALSTESTYIFWLRKFVTALDTMPDNLNDISRGMRNVRIISNRAILSGPCQEEKALAEFL